MQSMLSSPPEAIEASMFPLSPLNLLAAFAHVPDPRRPHGRRFPLAAILALAVTALLANHLSVLAIAQWGKRQSPAILAALGFPAGVTPHQTTMQRLFRTLDPLPLAVALTACFAPAPAAEHAPRGSTGVTFDGKAQRGRLACADHAEYPVGRPLGRCSVRCCMISASSLPNCRSIIRGRKRKPNFPPRRC